MKTSSDSYVGENIGETERPGDFERERAESSARKTEPDVVGEEEARARSRARAILHLARKR